MTIILSWLLPKLNQFFPFERLSSICPGNFIKSLHNFA